MTKEKASEVAYSLHPVHVTEIEPIRIDFEALVPPSAAQTDEPHGFRNRVKFGVKDDCGTVIISSEAEFNEKKEAEDVEAETRESPPFKPPYRLHVEIGMQFTYDPAEIARDEVELWCKDGAFFIASPFLRQLVYDIIARTGFSNVLMPFVEVPILQKGVAPEAKPTPE